MSERKAIVVATVLHGALLLVLSVSLNKPLPDQDLLDDFTPIEVVDISDVAQITEMPKPSMDAAPREVGPPPEAEAEAEPEIAPEPTPPVPAVVPKPVKPVQVDDSSPQDAIPEKAKPEPVKPKPKPKPEAKPEPKVEPKTEAKPKPPVKPAEPKKPVTEPKKASPAPAKPKDSFDAGAMAALIDKSKPEAPTRPKDVSSFASSIEKALPKNARLSASQAATLQQAIRSQIAPCWNPPTGGADVANMTAVLRIQLNKDGSVASAPEFVSQTGANAANQAYARAFVETAKRAVLRCAPLQLPADLYPHWREFELNFDPRLMT